MFRGEGFQTVQITAYISERARIEDSFNHVEGSRQLFVIDVSVRLDYMQKCPLGTPNDPFHQSISVWSQWNIELERDLIMFLELISLQYLSGLDKFISSTYKIHSIVHHNHLGLILSRKKALQGE